VSSVAERLALPAADGRLIAWQPAPDAPAFLPPPLDPPRTRVAFAAAHVVADPLASQSTGKATVDWEATLAFRRHLWSYGLGVADAMDTAQRGMGLPWETARELIERAGAEARASGGLLACGAGTDQLEEQAHTLDEIVRAYEEQCAVVEGAGARVIVMASRVLAASATSAEDYARVYSEVLNQLREPAILHWLGPMFDARLAGYWGSAELPAAMDACLMIIQSNTDRIDGIKVSLLDKDLEIEFRSRLPAGVRLYTGDDFNYTELIRGDDRGFSDALLGIFDPIAPVAATALHALDDGDAAAFESILGPTVRLSRTIFEAPTHFYKTGVVFLAWLAGHQAHFRMVGGLESARSVVHLAELFRLADSTGLLPDRERAVARMRLVLQTAGVDA
jgi:hypothetical protein